MTTNSITLAGISGGGQYGLGASSNTAVIGPKFLRTTDIVSGEIDWTRVPYCKADQKTIDKYRLSDGDIVISRTGANAGLTAFVTSPPENSIFAGYLVRFKIDRDRAVPKFVSYILVSDTWKHYVATTRTGSAQPQFNAKIMGDFPMLLPSIQVQKASSEVLGALDEKIQINKELSKTLEDIAQTIFKSWFIDFDPVKAKMAGGKPVGMDDATAALFPDSMEDSELGLIPRGWAVSTVGQFSPLVYGKALPAKDRNAGLISVFGSNGIVGSHNSALLQAPTVVIGRKGTVGTVTLQLRPSWVIDTAFSCSPEMPENLYFAYLALSDLKLNEMNSDAAVPGLNRENVHRLEILIATTELLRAFALMVAPLFELSFQLREETGSLNLIRDSLLPRLISGELQIPEEMLVT